MSCDSPYGARDAGNRCRCRVNSSTRISKAYPDPYEGTRYENDPALCYGMMNRQFPGCGYPFKGVIPGQFGKWSNPPYSAHYPWQNPDWPCPPRFDGCCEADCDALQPLPQPGTGAGQPRCYCEIPDGTVTGSFSACCCSEFYSACNPVCGGALGTETCGCQPYEEPEHTPLCDVEDGAVIRVVCPNSNDYHISGINKAAKHNSRGGSRICGGITIHYPSNANYTFCGGYKLRV